MNATIAGDSNNTDFYDAAPLEPHLLYQGEILVDVPILNMPRPTRWLLLRTRSGRPLDEALEHGEKGGLAKVLDSNQSKIEWTKSQQGDFAMGRLSKLPVLVLSQTCDVQTKDFIQVAPIFSIPLDLEPLEHASYLEKLQKDEILSAFLLPKHAPEIEHDSYADLELIQAVHRSYITRIAPENHFRLTDRRTRSLQRTVTRYFGRPNSFDAESDLAPTTATYLCVSCFYMGGSISSIEVKQGEPLTRCGVCSGRAWIVRGR